MHVFGIACAMPADGSLKQRLPTLRNRRITLLIVRLIRDKQYYATPVLELRVKEHSESFRHALVREGL